MSVDIQPFVKICDELSVEDDLVIRLEKVIPPYDLRDKLLSDAHEGYLGATLTKCRVREYFWWPQMDRDIDTMVQDCAICVSSDKTLRISNSPLTPIPLPDNPWEILGIDVLGPFPALHHQCCFAIVMVHYY